MLNFLNFLLHIYVLVGYDLFACVGLQVVVMRVALHCQGCAGKVKKHLSKMEGKSVNTIPSAIYIYTHIYLGIINYIMFMGFSLPSFSKGWFTKISHPPQRRLDSNLFL